MTLQLTSVFRGELLRFAAPRPDDAETFARWSENDFYLRSMENDPARPVSPEGYAAWEAAHLDAPNNYHFRLRRLADDALLGLVGLFGVEPVHQTAMLGITLGDPEQWGRGYGSEAMRLVLRYAFLELNLHRVGLTTIAFNERARRLFERCGFVREGAARQVIWREGERFDLLHYGLLREEWLARAER